MYCTLHICLQISAPRIYKLRHRVQHYLNDPMQTNAITDRIKTLCKRIEIWNEIKLVMEKRYNKCCRKKIYIYFFSPFVLPSWPCLFQMYFCLTSVSYFLNPGLSMTG